MGLKLKRDNYGRLLLIGASVIMWLLIIAFLNTLGYSKTWGLWQVPSARPVFLDFRLIPGSAESFVHGYEPSVENPFDPGERIFNYPAFWRLFFYTGITQSDTVRISVLMIILFFIGAFLFPQSLSFAGAVGMLLVLFSPASMLLYERGNVDLFVFFVCAMAVLATSYSAYLATALVLLASIMKLFPILGLSILLKESKKRFLWLAAVSVLVVIIYMAGTWNSVKASWDLTMRGDGLSYGTDVFVDRYIIAIKAAFSHWLTPQYTDLLVGYGPLTVALLLLFVSAILAFMNRKEVETFSGRNLAAFRMGASIYVGTFLLGNNWDYRLAFLVLLVPQLVEWLRSSQKIVRLAAWASVILVLLSCWHLWIVEIPLESVFNSLEDSRKFLVILDEIFNWLLFGSLAYLLFASAPEWVKELPGNILSGMGFHLRHGQKQINPPIS